MGVGVAHRGYPGDSLVVIQIEVALGIVLREEAPGDRTQTIRMIECEIEIARDPAGRPNLDHGLEPVDSHLVDVDRRGDGGAWYGVVVNSGRALLVVAGEFGDHP